MISARRAVIPCLLTICVLRGLPASDENWLAEPYRVTVWYSLTEDLEVAGAWQEEFAEALQQMLRLAATPDWIAAVAPAPEPVCRLIRRGSQQPPPDTLLTASPPLAHQQKLYLLRARGTLGGVRLAACEWDISSRQWGAWREQEVARDARLAVSAAQLVRDCFRFSAQVGRVQGDSAELMLRAGLLVDEASTGSLPQPGQLFQVWFRQTDRLGQLIADGIQEVPWTVLRVQEVDQGRARCEIISGLRSPLRVRSRRQVDRIALAVTQTLEHTTLQVLTDENATSGPAGYGVYVRSLDSKQLAAVGLTDWRGAIELDRVADEPLRLFYIRNGDRLLARLPLAVGASATARVVLPDDDPRLEAEGFVKGLQERIVDVVARRQVLGMRIRQSVRAGRLDEADRLFEEMRRLESRDDFIRQLRDRQQAFANVDRRTLARIDQLFQNTRKILTQSLDTSEIDQVGQMIQQAKRQG